MGGQLLSGLDRILSGPQSSILSHISVKAAGWLPTLSTEASVNSSVVHGAHVVREQLFSGKPYCTVGHFSKHHKSVDQLPPQERKKIQDAADFVAKSFSDPQLAGGFVIAIGIRGHADQDSSKSGIAQTDSEKKTSEEYANEVALALMRAIKLRAVHFGADSMPLGEPFDAIVEGIGAKMPVKNQAGGRVEVFLHQDKTLLLKATSHFDLPPQKRLPE
jgi:hypothetical protein